MKTHDFWYDLPEELIAQTPLERRDSSRLLVLDRSTGALEHRHFYDIIDYLNPGDCLVMNDSRVLPARLLGQRPTGGAVEVLLLRDLGGGAWECLVKPGRKMQQGQAVSFGDGALTATVTQVQEDGNRVVQFHYQGIFLEILERLGKMPLPPYIQEELQDQERYQTVYSRSLGSAAAPTAGLHFTRELLDRIRQKGISEAFVTLHVGLGTFRPVKAEEVTEHHMHSELCMLSQETADLLNATRQRGGPDCLRGHHLLPDPGVSGGGGRQLLSREQVDGHLHLSRLPLPGHGRSHHQFSPAGEHPCDAGLRLCRPGARLDRLQGGGPGAVPVL